MNDNKSTATSGGIGFTGLLTIAFIVLKLCNVITWSWWWVLSPIWISAGLVIGTIIVMLLVYLIADIVEARQAKKIRKFNNTKEKKNNDRI